MLSVRQRASCAANSFAVSGIPKGCHSIVIIHVLTISTAAAGPAVPSSRMVSLLTARWQLLVCPMESCQCLQSCLCLLQSPSWPPRLRPQVLLVRLHLLSRQVHLVFFVKLSCSDLYPKSCMCPCHRHCSVPVRYVLNMTHAGLAGGLGGRASTAIADVSHVQSECCLLEALYTLCVECLE